LGSKWVVVNASLVLSALLTLLAGSDIHIFYQKLRKKSAADVTVLHVTVTFHCDEDIKNIGYF